jgi:predicted metal-dependent peptidase
MTSVVPNFANKEPMSPADEKRIDRLLAKARTALVLEHPFIGNIALNLPFVPDYTCKTAWTNGKRIGYNPYFMDSFGDEERKFVVAHECLHPMLDHNFRRGERQHKRWNKAGDYVINQLLTDESIGKMPTFGLLNPQLYQAGNQTTDGIYNLLPDEPDEGGGGDGTEAMDDCQDGGNTPAEKAQQQAEWKVRVAQAAQAAKMMGKMSAGLERLVNDVLAPKVDWRDVLRKFVEKCRTDERSWARPNRRFLSQGLYLPSISGESLGEIAIAVDCSGSIDDKILAQFAGEINAIKEDGNPTKIHVVYFDSEVSHYESYGRDDALDIKAHGGGGTAFSPVFQYFAEHDIEPVACVFLTDLCCDDFGDMPSYPVLWVSTDEGDAPFGEVVVMK